ncbi:uracil-DNA glycosylase [Acetobacterium carbinolicum]|jgi:uracil-DNA glycosylase|uniref:uracil-DNA glycosylase n=1 Tax=Acetobacterium TaxID=33951 RepID=UPI000DBECE23|nr:MULTISPECIES: uracil-DNA glycosylase [unclassified Acetobacterium]AWW26745.1 uracil-DNA glycosylase [Acetobacterium sp. KB-1]MDZ5726745.1 uracil-DNA glycosylase [Acetobacterium sp. K1/6]
MPIHFNNDWEEPIQQEIKTDYYQNLRLFLIKEYRSRVVYPPMDEIFNAFHLTPLSKTKVCIIGQDPYHGPGQAHGLAFSVKPGVSIPPSLLNIYKELEADLGCPIPSHGCLTAWAEQGVLLLNAVLTVRGGEAGSHRNAGWEIFTSRIIERLNTRAEPVIFILWGRDAQNKKALITNPRHPIITSPHPSPLSAHRGFFGSRPFSKANDLLKAQGIEPIDWGIKDLDFPIIEKK